jgi:5-methylcytosine-specific restriction endonuclease McrA
MKSPSSMTNQDLLALIPRLVLLERQSSAAVIEHLVEIDDRRLYLDEGCASLSIFCTERLSYSEDEAFKRVRVTRLARRFPRVLDELRGGAIHLTGLFLLSPVMTPENHEELLAQARGKSKRVIEQLIAARFPRPDVAELFCPLSEQLTTDALARSGTSVSSLASSVGASAPSAPSATELVRDTGRLTPLSASRWCVQFTATGELADKITRARELLSHAVPDGALSELFERALDVLIEQETKRRLGAGVRRNRRATVPHSRHIPVDVARVVFERDEGQCTFRDGQGRRCSARKFVTLEHRHPYSLGGAATVENLCLLCRAHNVDAARKVFGESFIAAKSAARSRRPASAPKRNTVKSSAPADRSAAGPSDGHGYSLVHSALRSMGWKEREVRTALSALERNETAQAFRRPHAVDSAALLRAALALLPTAAAR